jgi:hypothetical protein
MNLDAALSQGKHTKRGNLARMENVGIDSAQVQKA